MPRGRPKKQSDFPGSLGDAQFGFEHHADADTNASTAPKLQLADLYALNLNELKTVLKKYKEPTSDSKAQLVQRLGAIFATKGKLQLGCSGSASAAASSSSSAAATTTAAAKTPEQTDFADRTIANAVVLRGGAMSPMRSSRRDGDGIEAPPSTTTSKRSATEDGSRPEAKVAKIETQVSGSLTSGGTQAGEDDAAAPTQVSASMEDAGEHHDSDGPPAAAPPGAAHHDSEGPPAAAPPAAEQDLVLPLKQAIMAIGDEDAASDSDATPVEHNDEKWTVDECCEEATEEKISEMKTIPVPPIGTSKSYKVLTLTATGPSVKNKDKQWVGRRLLEAVESTHSLRKQDFGVGVWREGDTGFSPDASTVEVHYHAVIALWEKARTRRFPEMIDFLQKKKKLHWYARVSTPGTGQCALAAIVGYLTRYLDTKMIDHKPWLFNFQMPKKTIDE
eukprot:g18513.t1